MAALLVCHELSAGIQVQLCNALCRVHRICRAQAQPCPSPLRWPWWLRWRCLRWFGPNQRQTEVVWQKTTVSKREGKCVLKFLEEFEFNWCFKRSGAVNTSSSVGIKCTERNTETTGAATFAFFFDFSQCFHTYFILVLKKHPASTPSVYTKHVTASLNMGSILILKAGVSFWHHQIRLDTVVN